MKAFVLLKVPALRSGGVAKILRGMASQGVKQAWALYGDEDIIVEVEVNDNHQLDQLVMTKIQSLPQVVATRTYIVVEDEGLYE